MPADHSDDVDAAAASRPLRELARARGVAIEYWDWMGNHIDVPDSTIVAVLSALGLDVSSAAAVDAALADEADRAWREVLPPSVVCRAGWTPWIAVHVPHGADVELAAVLEDGATRPVPQADRWVAPREIDGALVGEATFELPGDLPLGWHRLRAVIDDELRAEATLIVTPARLELPAALRDDRRWGLMAQLYATRSSQSWGIGDLADLATVAGWGGRELGADFVLVNPLHAAQPAPPIEASPYRPVTRRFASPLYLRPELIAEADLPAAASVLNAADDIDRDAVWEIKDPVLRDIYARGRTPEREAEFRRFCDQEGEGLADFAVWCALATAHGSPWRQWPEALHDPRSAQTAAFAAEHADEVRYHQWLQWQLAEQLASAQLAATEAGMRLGIVHDLAVGVHPDGADAWALGDALARGVTVGAPPDQFNQLGQDWQQPPWRPDALARLGYAPYRDMLRTVLRSSAGVRVDHVMGLFRLWWVPEGRPAGEGTYVYYDAEAMIGVLALEAHRAGAVVIGEDLGVVEPRVRDHLRDLGMFGTSILWFEWRDGRPLPPEDYRELCLATVTTHDLPPTAGYLELEHVAIRERLGLLTRTPAEERRAEQDAIAAIRAALAGRGLATEPPAALVASLHSWLTLTPARLLGVAVSDLVGDRRAVNQPGTSREYPNWRVPVAGPSRHPMPLEEIMAAPPARRLAAVVNDGLGRGAQR